MSEVLAQSGQSTTKSEQAQSQQSSKQQELTPTEKLANKMYAVNNQQTKAEASQEPVKDASKTESKEQPKAEERSPVSEQPKTDQESKAPESKESQEQPKDEVKYDLKLPENSPLDTKHVENVVSFSKANKLSQEQAKAVLEREHADAANRVALYQERVDNWIDSAYHDKEIGGENLRKSAELGKRVIDRFGTEDLKKELKDSKLGNHPEFIRLCARIGRAMDEDKFVQAGGDARQPVAIEDIFYPKQKKG